MRRNTHAFAGTILRCFAARVLAAAALAAAIATPLLTSSARAYPTDSPSARAAARLKNRPPRNWIRHYLGDDRYKIAGGTWKFVSTELDRFYYPAYAPEMLRQSPNRVIGFSSAKDALEAGYFPASGYAGLEPTFDPVYAGVGASRATAPRDTVNRTKKSIIITLSDGVSTVLLPPNWRRTVAGSRSTLAGQAAVSDVLQPLSGGGSITFSFVTAPINVEPFMSASSFPALAQMASQRGGGQGAAALNSVRVDDAQLGGLKGIRVSPKAGAPAMFKGRTMAAARGSKVFVVQSDSNAAGGGNVVSSFRAR